MSVLTEPLPAVEGRIASFGGPHDAGPKQTASGIPPSKPGVAVFNRATLGGYWKVTAANGKTAVLKQTDVGPAPITGRALDVSHGALPKLGYTEDTLKGGSTAKAVYVGEKMPAGMPSQKAPALPKGGQAASASSGSAPKLLLPSPAPAAGASKGSGLPLAPVQVVVDKPALQEARGQTAANRIVLNSLGGGASDPLSGVLSTAEPNPSEFEVVKTPKLATTGASGAAGAAPPTVAPEAQGKALSAAVTQLGTPYRWGGEEERKGFDCSGLTQWSYRAVGISIPRTAQEQFNASEKVNQAQPGDLVFFGSSPTNVTHVEIVAGNGRMIGADHTGTNVRYESLPAVGSKWGEDTVLAIGVPRAAGDVQPLGAAVPSKLGTNATPTSFAQGVLKSLGAPTSGSSLRAMEAWEAQEGGNWQNLARFNPLNTTEPMPGAGNTGAQGNIKVYQSWQQGLEATLRTLQAYPTIVNLLRAGAPVGSIEEAINRSPWGTHFSSISSEPGTGPVDSVTAGGHGSVIAAYNAPAGPRAIVHYAAGPKAGKVEHVAGNLPPGHQFAGGDILGAPLKAGL